MHFSDFPGILSGDQIGFLDPHEACFTCKESDFPEQRTSSHCWRLTDPTLNTTLRDQVQPFLHDLFGSEDCLRSRHFDGTVFRFPLRRDGRQSRLSKTVYDEKKVRNLFDMFEKEAHVFLLFLNNIQKIEVYEKQDQNSQPQLLMSVCVANEEAINERKEFRERVAPFAMNRRWMHAPHTSTYKMVTRFCHGEANMQAEPNEKTWLVAQYYDGGDDSPAEPFMKSESSKFLPWMGTALEMTGENLEGCNGELFCFLPLPQHEDSPTGLNVHVNGYFSVSQDR